MSFSDVLIVDTETNWTKDWDARYVLGVNIHWDDNYYYIPVGHTSWLTEANNQVVPKDLLHGLVCDIVFHNAKFDIQMLEKIGVEVPPECVQDTMMMSHYVREDVGKRGHSLDHLAEFYHLTNKATDMSKAMRDNWDNMPAEAMGLYGAQDTLATRELYEYLDDNFQEFADMWETYDRPFLFLLKEMEQKGMRINLDECRRLESLCRNRLTEIEVELGFDPAKPSQLHPKLFSPPPLGYGLVPLSVTPGGKPQVNKKFLERTHHPVIALIQEHRLLKKQLSSYYVPYQKLALSSGVIHPDFRQHGTVTGRLSCADPNLQQLPRDSPIKKLFLAEEGYKLWELDYSNLELRLATVYSKQPALVEEFSDREGDVHGRVAEELGITRFQAKTVNFLITYGGREHALASLLFITIKEAKKILDAYEKKYKELFTTAHLATRTAQGTDGVVKTWSGHKRHFVYQGEYHKAFNSVVQGGAFEIVKRSMLLLQDAGFDMRNQVHDSVWIQMKIGEESRLEEAQALMENWAYDYFGLPFFVDIKAVA